MGTRSPVIRSLALLAGFLAFGAGLLVVAAVLVVRPLVLAGSQLLGVVLQEIVGYLYVLAALELSALAVIWTTQGPIPALAWVASRYAAWQGP
jgi:hypothetical protein